MKKTLQALNYLKYRLFYVNEHKVHSPFVFDLLIHVFYNKKAFYCYEKIEELRNKLESNNKVVFHQDFGAGSSITKNKTLKVKHVAANAAKSAKYAQLLFRLVNYFQPNQILEFGTSLGISSSYIFSGNLKSNFITMEGSPQIAAIANENFEKLKLNNIKVKVGNFDTILSDVLNEFTVLDFVFFDGNHRKEATLNYFHQCLKKAHNNSVFVFDDIYWSAEMVQAWEEIKNHPEVTVTIDVFQLGIVFFRKEQAKQHFIIKY